MLVLAGFEMRGEWVNERINMRMFALSLHFLKEIFDG